MLNDMGGRPRVADTVRRAFRATGMSAGSNWLGRGRQSPSESGARRVRAILTNCIRHGPASQNRAAHPDFRAYLAGRVAHARALNAARGAKLHALFARIAWDGCGFGA
jgi:protocatechuate 3,4-dioxygenase beta subunit